MEVLVPLNFDLESIDKCLVDYYCKFVELDDIEKRIGTTFVILQEKYFIFYVGKYHNIVCDYNCRNFVMKRLYPRQGDYDKLMNTNFDGKLNLVDNIFYNIEMPYLLFTKENIQQNGAEDNTIIKYYEEINIERFAQITKENRCNKNFFVV